MSWTVERTEKLKRLAGEGLSSGMIATEFGDITRNAVIGKLARLGISTGNQPFYRHTLRRKSGEKVVRVRKKTKAVPVLFEEQEAVELPADQSDFAVSFFEARENQCRYPLGDQTNLETFRFCGADTLKGCSMCRRHFSICHTTAKTQTASEREKRRRHGLKMFGRRASY